MKLDEWKEKIAHRSDMTGHLVHLTKPVKLDECNKEGVDLIKECKSIISLADLFY